MASLSEISIRRPVLTVVMSVLILLFGGIGFSFLGVREFPSIDTPIITVSTNYTGANADIMESQVTEVLEESINGIAGIRTLSSSSRDGRSNITVEFDISVDLEAAANDVRDRVSRVQNLLPPDCDPPTVAKADADANPIVYVGVKSANRGLLQLSDVASNLVKERLQTIPGVSAVQIWGEKKYSMRLWMNPQKLAAFGLAPSDVLSALSRENIELPSGRVEGQRTELTVRTMGRLTTEDDFNNLIIKQVGDNLVRFKDIGYAQLGPENERTLLKNNGEPMVGVVLIPQPGSNQIDIATQFYKRLETIKKELPEGYELILGFDNTEYIRDSIHEVNFTILLSLVLVVAIIFFFLRDWRTTLIPILAIPISLVGSFFVMYLLGFSINVLTLLAIVLAIGLVVDDAIVVLENIFTKVEEGEEPLQAAYKGSAEIYFAVIATTVVLAAVFLPVVFLQGITGRLFREFGVVLAASVIISAFVSLTLTPMLSARMLKKSERPNWFYRVTEPFFVWLTDRYERSLRAFMAVRWVSLLVVAAAGGLIYFLGGILKSELAPMEDRNAFRLVGTGPEGATFEYMDLFADKAADTFATYIKPEERKVIVGVTSPSFGSSAANSAFVRVILKRGAERSRTQQDMVKLLTPKINKLTEARSVIVQDPTISVGGGRGITSFPIAYVIQAPNQAKLAEYLPKFMAEAQESKLFTYVDANLKFNKPEIQVDIDRNKARALGVSVQDIAQTLQLALSGQRFGYYIQNGKQYQVIGQVDRENRDEPLDMTSLYVKSRDGQLIQLDNLVRTAEQSTPPALFRFNRYSAATISAQLAPGVALSDGLNEMDRIADSVLDDTFTTALDGQSRDFKESSSSLLFSFLIALLLIYLILAAQFEGFASPLVIMFTVPLALLGALGSLWYFEQTLNIFSQIGIIMLIGMVTKNGILIVEFANQRLEHGDIDSKEAGVLGGVIRFRAILMTALSCILGTLPIALALGAGSESRVSLGIAVVGGMTFSTLLSLYIIPTLYSYLVRAKKSVAAPVTSSEEIAA